MPTGSTAPDISVIINAHSEGRLAHRSVRSAERAVRHAREQGIEVEFVAVLDYPSPETLACIEGREQAFDLIERVEFGDPGLSRNRGVELSRGRHVAFIDAGDLYSENWLAAAFQFALAHGDASKVVLHPELNLFFGGELFLSSSINSNSPGYSPLELIEFNPWTTLNFVARAFFLEGNQYVATKDSGFGCEGWHWNCQAITDGAVHLTVPRTVHFIRSKSDATRQTAGVGATFPPSRLFDDPAAASGPRNVRDHASALKEEGSMWAQARLESVDAAPVNGGRPSPLTARRGRGPRPHASFIYRRVREAAIGLAAPRPNLLEFFVNVTQAARKLRAASSRPPLDCDWLIAEWRRIHEIEPELFPSAAVLKTLDRRATPRSIVASHYPALYDLFGAQPTHVYLLPWLKRGGADIEAMHYMTAVLRQEPDSKVVCVTTESADSEWLFMLPKEIRVVEFGKLLEGFLENEKASLLLRLLIQKSPRVIHNINSALGYRLYTTSGPALSAQSRLYATIFGVEPMPEGRVGGYGIWDLPHCIDYLSGAFTDSRWFADWLCDTFGFAREKFSVQYVPAPPACESRVPKFDGGVLNVLWASRLDVEKRPDVLFRIASGVAHLPVHFHVYGIPVYSPSMSEFIDRLGGLPNVTTYGAYDGFQSIPSDRYDLFLYTSERDGLPNVLLEAVAAGLPVVAPDVGGIKELINDRTGFLVSSAEAVDEYVGHVKRIQSDYTIVALKVEAAKALVESRHSWASFISGLRRAPEYLTIS